ncbi:MAG: glycogen/starch synthase [Anaerolineales bacterium]|nr:glycogen synthase [Anaerolineales bacterium]MCS7247314.1 glycogen synthase [Anaerolineales bacterium]MDW8161125.1 glycogen/starch synthase [Anaerolineales bacterium]MDW8446128.1 glycogen/starch synthase [Anaerolineales bacterium]
MKVFYLAAEAEPFIKVGGLGDVAGSLPGALQEVSNPGELEIRVAIPFHGAIQQQPLPLKFLTALQIPHYPQPLQAQVYELEHSKVKTYFIGGPLFAKDSPVYSPDASTDALKYTFFSLACLELVQAIEWRPDVVHANDWHTAPALYAIKVHEEEFFHRTAKVITIHNLPYLGHGAGEVLTEFGLPPATESGLPAWAQQLPLPLGIYAADRIVAVSPTYAQEIQTPDFGAGLEEYLSSRQKDIIGILNGIDLETWNPSTDPYIPYPYDAERIERKERNKQKLFEELGWQPVADAPLLAMITRLDYQKGIDIALGALRSMREQAWQAVILGTGSPAIEQSVRQLQLEIPDRLYAVLRFDPHLSHRVYAAADLLLIPSRYEPCGLAQMIAMRYGTVPVGRATGGLRDTILDTDNPSTSTGFLFEAPQSEALGEALARAFKLFPRRRAWRAMQRNGMAQDFSWARSARRYLEVYREVIEQKTQELERQKVFGPLSGGVGR